MASIQLTLALLLSLFVTLQTAAVPASCYYAGKVYQAGEQFTMGERFEYKCEAEGVTCIGCKTDSPDIGLLPLPTTKTVGEFKYECYKDGTSLYYRKSASITSA